MAVCMRTVAGHIHGEECDASSQRTVIHFCPLRRRSTILSMLGTTTHVRLVIFFFLVRLGNNTRDPRILAYTGLAGGCGGFRWAFTRGQKARLDRLTGVAGVRGAKVCGGLRGFAGVFFRSICCLSGKREHPSLAAGPAVFAGPCDSERPEDSISLAGERVCD